MNSDTPPPHLQKSPPLKNSGSAAVALLYGYALSFGEYLANHIVMHLLECNGIKENDCNLLVT